jgi:hypothetical protein
MTEKSFDKQIHKYDDIHVLPAGTQLYDVFDRDTYVVKKVPWGRAVIELSRLSHSSHSGILKSGKVGDK